MEHKRKIGYNEVMMLLVAFERLDGGMNMKRDSRPTSEIFREIFWISSIFIEFFV
jgi:hypothetical protein